MFVVVPCLTSDNGINAHFIYYAFQTSVVKGESRNLSEDVVKNREYPLPKGTKVSNPLK